MAIIEADFSLRLSGGASQTDPALALGGAKSSEVVSSSINGLFPAVSAAQALAGRVDYRCVYLHNANATDLMTALRNWIEENSPNADTTLDIGVGTAAINATEQTIANTTTAPTGVTFSAPADAASALALGNIPAGQHRSIWLRRTVNAGAENLANDNAILAFDAETA